MSRHRTFSLSAVALLAAAGLMLASSAGAQSQKKGEGKYEEHYEILPPVEDEPGGDAVPGDGALDPEGSTPEPARQPAAKPKRQPDDTRAAVPEDGAKTQNRDPRGRETERSDTPRAGRSKEAAPVEEIEHQDQQRLPRERAARSNPPAVNVVPEEGEDIADVAYFYEALDEGGAWISHPRFGEVWQPNVEKDWRPYTIGRWAYADDYGWTWISAEPFGWAVFHYGRWTYDNREGWLWIPGTEWAPAWVAWRQGEDAIGWAPLPPSARFANGRLNVAESALESDGVDRGWVFVRPRYFAGRDMRKFVRAPSWNTDLVHRTAPRLGYERSERGLANRGLSPEDVEKLSSLPVRRVKIKPTDDASLARRAGKSDDDAKGDQVRLFKPDKKRTADVVKRAERKKQSTERDGERRAKRDASEDGDTGARDTSVSGRAAARDEPAARSEKTAGEPARAAPSNAPKNTVPRASTPAKAESGSEAATDDSVTAKTPSVDTRAATGSTPPAGSKPAAEKSAAKPVAEPVRHIETGATATASGTVGAPRQPPPDGSKRRWDTNGPSGAGSTGGAPKADREQE